MYTRRGRKNHCDLELHLLDYHKKVLEYLNVFESLPDTRLDPLPLKNFSKPHDKQGFNSNSISDDMVTEVFLGFSEKTRNEESDEYTRTLTGMAGKGPYLFISFNSLLLPALGRCVSGDGTFKTARKGTISDSKGKRSKVLKGGIMTFLNEISEIISWASR